LQQCDRSDAVNGGDPPADLLRFRQDASEVAQLPDLARCQREYDQQAVEEERMAKFLAFKDHRGQEIYVNAALVRAVRSEGESGAWIDFDGEHSIRTPSPANAVVRDLEKAV
jgi:hypothetical protein